MSGNETDFSKVVLFVEKYCQNGLHLVNTFSDDSIKSFIALLWTLYQDARFETVKGRRAIEMLLSTCLGTSGGTSVTLKRCTNALARCVPLRIKRRRRQSWR